MNEEFNSQEVANGGISGIRGELGSPESCLLHPYFLLESLQEDPGAECGPCPSIAASLGEEAGAGGC